ncbi:GntR family transcriptional regulator [Nitratireductor sp. ZSWI3]|uniref:GntR family transcriptional regulator n=1 Tax=Nitratireductor sp. ZSWI3 TaxID=2966359 RepID=UPI00214F6A80|nr:GntR family transcriptional regulator [Nitratireductor sp. ZSWI3]MCR4268675.1 GntR family transcriptional regulator [Nitratireductor sp. ZSWI3]
MLKLDPIDVRQSASAADLVFEALRKAIVEGDLAEGEHLRQDHIARLFNTSRIPVREALKRLEQDGLVTNERYRGTVVAALSSAEVEEIFEFRALIESEIVRLAVPRLTPEHLAEAQRHLQAFASERDPSLWGEINRNFHYSLYAAADRPYHLQVIRSSLDRVDRYLRAQLTLTDGIGRARAEHQAIYDVCAGGNADEAARLTRAHILDASRSLLAFLDQRRR